jgi:hypothetical protein
MVVSPRGERHRRRRHLVSVGDRDELGVAMKGFVARGFGCAGRAVGPQAAPALAASLVAHPPTQPNADRM